MQFECLILGTSDNQRVSDRHAATWSVHSLGKTAREERESGEEYGLFWESIRLVNPIKKKKKAGENKYLKDFFMIIERLQFFIIYDKKK